jgi:hypothetical protein
MAKPSLADWTGLFGAPRTSADSGDDGARRRSSEGSVPHLAGVSLARARERAAQGVSQAEQNLVHTHHDGPVYQPRHARVQSTDCSGPLLHPLPQVARRGSDDLRAALAEAQAELVPALVAAPPPAHLMPTHARSRESSNDGSAISRPHTPASRSIEPQLPPSWLAARGAGGSPAAPNVDSGSPPRATRPPSLLRSLSSRSIHAAPPALASGSTAQLLRSTATGIISSPTEPRAPTLPPTSLHAGDARPFATLARPGEEAAPSSDYDGSTAASDLRERRASSDDVADQPSIWDIASASLGLAPDVHGEHAHEAETGSGFYGAMERLRATLGLDKDGGDWIQSHRSALDAALAKATAAAASGTAAPDSEKPEGKSVHIHPSKAQKEASSDKVPLVFAHGLFGFDQLALGPKSMPLIFNYWRGITEVLKERGTEVLVARVPASASIQERAEALRDVIERHFGGREINLIGHSMGGECGVPVAGRVLTTRRTRLALPHLAPRDELHRQVAHDDCDAAPRICACRVRCVARCSLTACLAIRRLHAAGALAPASRNDAELTGV